MMEFIKREKKFVAVAILTVALVFLLQATAVSNLLQDAHSNKVHTDAAAREWGDLAKKLYTDVKAAPKVGGEPAEDFKVTALTTRYRSQADDLQEAKTSLLGTLEWKSQTEFTIEDDGELKDATWYAARFNERRAQLVRRYGNQQAYAYVVEPRLGDPNIDANLAFDCYENEAEAWAGLAKAKPQSPGAGLGGPRVGFGRGSTQEEPEETPEEHDRKVKEKARAIQRLRMVLLGIASRIIEAGRTARLDRVEHMGFVRRSSKMAERFQVEQAFASFYRPVCFELVIHAQETQLMQFLEIVSSTRASSEKGQFLAIESLNLDATDQALHPKPDDQLVVATVTLVAWLVDANLEFSASSSGSRRNQAGSGRYRWGGR